VDLSLDLQVLPYLVEAFFYPQDLLNLPSITISSYHHLVEVPFVLVHLGDLLEDHLVYHLIFVP
jgi:hypothetical protein